jgi:hypothetical protein
MAWLAVDKRGTECVFKRKPKRVKTTNKWNDVVIKFVREGRLYASACGYEYHPTHGDLQTIKQSTRSNLPKGTIKRLIGKGLTWDNEPVKI